MKCTVFQTAHFFFRIHMEEKAYFKGALEVEKPDLGASEVWILRK